MGDPQAGAWIIERYLVVAALATNLLFLVLAWRQRESAGKAQIPQKDSA